MECDRIEAGDSAEYLRRFNARAVAERVPLAGNFALTYRCNLRCRHCYARGSACTGSGGELETGEVNRVVTACAEAGCLSLVLTGGEPLLRADFPAIYRHAKLAGLRVILFTNGTLVTDEVIALFCDLPPSIIEISLYGATAGTYERITGVEGSYEACRRSIEKLLAAGFPPRLKTVLMTWNIREFEAMEKLAADYGLKFRLDPAIFPAMDGDRSPLDLRVSPEQAVEKELANADRARSWKEFLDRQGPGADTDRLYTCGAGVKSFFIDPAGRLQPCVMVNGVAYDLTRGNFEEGWRHIVAAMNERKAGPEFVCRSCEKKTACGYCPGFFQRETGSETKRSEYLCSIGEKRLELIHANG